MKLIIPFIFLLAIMPAMTSGAENGFAVYLVNSDGADKEALASGKHTLRREQALLFTQEEIISYSTSKRSMILTADALGRLKKVGVGTRFVACVDSKAIYEGQIWSALLSASCPDIVMMIPLNNESPVFLLTGYPNVSYFKGKDERTNKLILDALRTSGKLTD